MKKFLVYVMMIVPMLTFLSCTTSRKSVYFVDQKDAVLKASNLSTKSIIQPNDILSIAVTSLNNASTEVFNKPNNSFVSTSSVTGANLQSPGYLVNDEGMIQFPVLGSMKIAGMTTNVNYWWIQL
jgi:polysaccharide export outer membrane protein